MLISEILKAVDNKRLEEKLKIQEGALMTRTDCGHNVTLHDKKCKAELRICKRKIVGKGKYNSPSGYRLTQKDLEDSIKILAPIEKLMRSKSGSKKQANTKRITTTSYKNILPSFMQLNVEFLISGLLHITHL
ncbi:hypothetical protein RFI_13231 [Reticulomyxa filosa]|uniref:Uncharacterized protein n=1 Tax=Reticulomyxa filosa TaxID=46433 RepID=X6NDG4_RETFI|nr:hypothetical protein RFI_13231 [Reticulomyxa filosa]|eukprot:ETO23923.1 hypothetical protein RFI_13231 [Reticulomyxa filosa]